MTEDFYSKLEDLQEDLFSHGAVLGSIAGVQSGFLIGAVTATRKQMELSKRYENLEMEASRRPLTVQELKEYHRLKRKWKASKLKRAGVSAGIGLVGGAAIGRYLDKKSK